jgi:hypothetical protein
MDKRVDWRNNKEKLEKARKKIKKKAKKRHFDRLDALNKQPPKTKPKIIKL